MPSPAEAQKLLEELLSQNETIAEMSSDEVSYATYTNTTKSVNELINDGLEKLNFIPTMIGSPKPFALTSLRNNNFDPLEDRRPFYRFIEHTDLLVENGNFYIGLVKNLIDTATTPEIADLHKSRFAGLEVNTPILEKIRDGLLQVSKTLGLADNIEKMKQELRILPLTKTLPLGHDAPGTNLQSGSIEQLPKNGPTRDAA